MKKQVYILSLFLISIFLCSSFVSAWWIFGNNDADLVGQAYTKNVVNIKVKESVKCVFNDATTEQSCYSEKGSCKGIGTCVIDISGKKGEPVTWKSTCGGYAYTTMDGQNDYAEFKCGTDVKESVKCVFNDATTEQSCYSEKGSCKGIGTCVIDISGKKGEPVTWKSTCGGYAYTIIDRQNEYAKFSCKIISTNTTVATDMVGMAYSYSIQAEQLVSCFDGEYRLSNIVDGHYYGIQKCSGGIWS